MSAIQFPRLNDENSVEGSAFVRDESLGVMEEKTN